MASDNSFKTTVDSLFKGMDSFITTKTVVGEAITVGDTIILPLIDVSFGVAAGAFVSPSAVLVISGGSTKLVNVKNQDGLTKILDMVPDFVNKFTDGKKEEAAAAKEPAKKAESEKKEAEEADTEDKTEE